MIPAGATTGEINRFSFVKNDPLNFVDAYGLMMSGWCLVCFDCIIASGGVFAEICTFPCAECFVNSINN
jgi:hypothetical protein